MPSRWNWLVKSRQLRCHTCHIHKERPHCIRPRTTIWRRHERETFSASLALCEGNSPVTDEFPLQRPVTRSFEVFFDLRLNKRLSKQSIRWWFETPSCPLWCHSKIYKARLQCIRSRTTSSHKMSKPRDQVVRSIWNSLLLLSKHIPDFRKI